MAYKRQPYFRLMPAQPEDLDQIMEIERISFSSPWSRQVFVQEFEHSFSRLVVLRGKESEKILAYINFWYVHDEIHILNVATHPKWRRKGFARQLIHHAIQSGINRGSSLITLEVRRSNKGAINLYHGFGFKSVDIRKRYYENNEDAIIMVLDLSLI